MSVKHLNNEEKLDAIYEMTLENNDILRTIRRQQYFANFLRVLYWMIVIGALGSAYYFIRPIISVISNNSGKIEDTVNQFNQLKNQLPEAKVINQLLNEMKPKTVAPAQ